MSILNLFVRRDFLGNFHFYQFVFLNFCNRFPTIIIAVDSKDHKQFFLIGHPNTWDSVTHLANICTCGEVNNILPLVPCDLVDEQLKTNEELPPQIWYFKLLI